MLWVWLTLAGAGADAGAGAPTARELAQSYFVAGDVKRAVDAARVCLSIEGQKKCEAFYRALVEYKALVPNDEHLSPAEAKQFLEWDRQISPQTRGKLTQGVYARYVEGPLESARQAAQHDDAAKVIANAMRALEVDPKNVDALQLIERYRAR